MLPATGEGDSRLYIRFQGQPPLKEYRFKGQHAVFRQGAEVQCFGDHFGFSVVVPGKLQQILHQRPHLMGHGQNAVFTGFSGLGLGIRLLQKLGVGQNYRQGRFQLVGGIADKLPLLGPGFFHRPGGPAGQQQGNAEKDGQTSGANQQAVFGKAVQGSGFTGGVGKDQGQGPGGFHLQVTQAVIRHGAQVVSGMYGRVNQVVQENRIRQVVIAAGNGGNLSPGGDLDDKVGKPYGFGPDARQPLLKGILCHGFHHGNALFFQIHPGKMV